MLGMALAIAAVCSSVAFAQDASSAEEQAYAAKMTALAKSLRPRSGDIALETAKATLHLSKDYYFLDAADSKRVIVGAWGNPPEQVEGVLGMVFPAGKSFADIDAWGAVITYEMSGYVTDDDAASADFDALMSDMKDGEAEQNEERVKQGYPAIHLVGWAEKPVYDRTAHSVVWARDLKFGEASDHSLNYDVRLLGRSGVLSLNMVSTMSHLPEVKAAAAKFSRAASFDEGFAYKDYVEGVDQAAGYGIGGLVAAGVGAAAVKKLGLLAVLLAFGKKFVVFILIGLAAAWKFLKGLFVREQSSADEEAVPAVVEAELSTATVDEPAAEEPPTVR